MWIVIICGIVFVWSWAILEKMDSENKVGATADLDLSKVTRFEVIDHSLPFPEAGRVYTKRDIEKLEFSVQDEGRTLKVFISKNNEHI